MLTVSGNRPAFVSNPASPLPGPSFNPEAPLDRYGVSSNSIGIPAYGGDVVTIPLTSSVNAAPVLLQNGTPPTSLGNQTPSQLSVPIAQAAVVYVEVNGVVYQQVASDPGPGQFSYNSSNQQLSLGGAGLIGSVFYSVQVATGFTNILFGKFPANLRSVFVGGELGYSYDANIPALAVTASATDLNAASYLAILTPGVFEMQANGTPFRLASRTVTEVGRSNETRFDLSFEGIHAPYGQRRNGLDVPIPIKAELLQGDECSYTYTISDVLKKAGVPITGSIPIEIKVGRNVDEKATITARSVLEGDYPLVAGKIVRFDGNAIEIVNPNQTTFHSLADADILGDFSFEYNGDGDIVNGVPLVAEWKNAVLELDTDPLEGGGNGDEAYTLVSKSSSDPTQPPTNKDPFGFTVSFNPNNLRTTDWVFDAGGRTDTIETTEYLNGQTVKVARDTYGFVYTSIDIYNLTAYLADDEAKKIFTNPVPSSLWKLVRHEETDILFDREGYEIGRQTVGFELSRPRQEQGDDLLEFIAEREDPATTGDRIDQLTKLISLYGVIAGASYTTFFEQTPIAPSTTYTLEPLSKYYKDVPQPDEGQPVPRFAKAVETSEDTIKTIANPESTAASPQPPIVYGRYQIDKQEVDIISAKAPEIFEERSQQQTKESENLSQTAIATQFQQNAGRPGIQARLTQALGCQEERAPYDDNTPKLKYLISTVSHPSFTAETEVIRFTGAYDFETALAAAKLKAKIDNMKALTVQIQINADRPIRVWDSIYWRGREWKVTNISRVELSQYKLHTLSRYQLTLGIWQDIPVTIKTLQEGKTV